MLYLYDENTGEQTTYEYEQQVSLTDDVCRIRLQIDANQIVEAVLKKKEKFAGTLDGALQNMQKIVAQRTSSIVKEISLHRFLAQEAPQYVVPLVFADAGKFTYIVTRKKLVPVKISVYCARDSKRADLKLGQKSHIAAQRLISDAIDTYFNGEKQANTDWAQTRNIIYSNGKCLFHDFDMSV